MSTHSPNNARLRAEELETRWQPSAPVAPTYAVTFADAVTTDNQFTGADGKQYWTIDAGADQYQNDVYERPTAQTFQARQAASGGIRFAASEYLANLDIAEGRAGFDDTFVYVSVKLAGLTEHKSDGSVDLKGLTYQYGFRLAKNADGGGGVLVVADQPGQKNPVRYGGQSTFIYRDANGDVGGTGRDVTKQDRQAEVQGNGYDRVVASDGRMNGRQVLWVRTNPTDPTVVEFALDYKAVGLTASDLRALPYLEFEANKGLQDPGNYAWNDEYTKSEAGSPYAGTGGLSAYETQGLGNIYELDTLRGRAITPPAEGSLSGFVFLDANWNEVWDGPDEPLAGVEIYLMWTDAAGNAQERVTTTGEDGSYRFAGLAGGIVYTIREVQPLQYVDGADFLGSLGGEQENDTFHVFLPIGAAGTDYNFSETFSE